MTAMVQCIDTISQEPLEARRPNAGKIKLREQTKDS
jgi:hypothetical protein